MRKLSVIVAELIKQGDADIIIVDGEIIHTGNDEPKVTFEIKPYQMPDIDIHAYIDEKPKRDKKQEKYRSKYHNRKR